MPVGTETERCPSCGRTDAEWVGGRFALCNYPWHADAHLRKTDTPDFVLDGRLPTDAERELLTVLQEECNEVAAECNRVSIKISKMLRFGVGQTNPVTSLKNDVEFCNEVGQLTHMLNVARRFPFYDVCLVAAGIEQKKRKLAHFLLHAESPPPGE